MADMKDFDGWNGLKKQLDRTRNREYRKPRQVWYCAVGLNVGSEQNGKGQDFGRPVLVLKVFSKDVFVGLPLTSRLKSLPFYYPVFINGQEGSVILSQIRLFDRRRLRRHLDTVPQAEFDVIKSALADLIFSAEQGNPSRGRV